MEKDDKKEFIGKIPIIYTKELKNMDNFNELLDIIKERKEEAKNS